MSATKTMTRRGADSTSGAYDPGNLTAKKFSEYFNEIVANIETVIKGKTDVVRLALVAIVCEGHILFEDVPGTGKTVVAADHRHGGRCRRL